MDYKGLTKYFTPKNIVPQIIGYVIVGFGVLVAAAYWIYFGIPIIAVGGAVVFFTRDSRMTDAEVDGVAAAKIKNLEDRARAELDVHEKELRGFPPEVFAGYDFTVSEGLMTARGHDKKYRSDRYAAAQFVFAQDLLHILSCRFRLTCDDERTMHISERYENLSCAEVRKDKGTFTLTTSKTPETFERELCWLVIKNNDGATVFEVPVDPGADVDRTISSVNQLIKARKAKLAGT